MILLIESYQHNSLSLNLTLNLNFKGEIIWDRDKPDGTPRKKLDTSYINKLGWESKTNLDRGIEKSINSYKNQFKHEFIS